MRFGFNKINGHKTNFSSEGILKINIAQLSIGIKYKINKKENVPRTGVRNLLRFFFFPEEGHYRGKHRS